MAFVVSSGQLAGIDRTRVQQTFSLRLSDGYTQDYAEIWRTQPAVRTVVAFLARNIASLGLHVFHRVSDTDRQRLTDHPLANLFDKPNPKTTWFRLANGLVHDLGIYDCAYWAKMKATDGTPGLIRLPPEMVEPQGDSWLGADKFRVKGSKGFRDLDPEQVVHFRGYRPDDERTGTSPIEALRATLAEEWQANRYREAAYRNGARMSGYLERPATAPQWEKPAKDRFRQSWQAQYAGDGGQVGGTPILEDGMTFKPVSQTAEQLQYIEARKLTREEVAAAYFIPPPMVGILDHATYSNIDTQHRMLYQDTLGPWLSMIQQDIKLQLVPDVDSTPGIYVEFNLAEKLKGSFEEQAGQLQTAVGAPWVTRNEARARQNLPAIDGGDLLVTPLNVLLGGQASPTDSAPSGTTGKARPHALAPAAPADLPALCPPADKPVELKARAPETYVAKHSEVLTAFFKRQQRSVSSDLGAKRRTKAPAAFDSDRWNAELAADLYALSALTATKAGQDTLDDLGLDADDYDQDRTLAWLKAQADGVATGINEVTAGQLDAALDADDPASAVAQVFELAATVRAAQIAAAQVTALSGFGTVEAARQTGRKATKTWQAGANPRSAHSAIDGETVAVASPFSNGAMWPGDHRLSEDQRAGCNCHITVTIQ